MEKLKEKYDSNFESAYQLASTERLDMRIERVLLLLSLLLL